MKNNLTDYNYAIEMPRECRKFSLERLFPDTEIPSDEMRKRFKELRELENKPPIDFSGLPIIVGTPDGHPNSPTALILAHLLKDGGDASSAAKLALQASDELILAMFTESIQKLKWEKVDRSTGAATFFEYANAENQYYNVMLNEVWLSKPMHGYAAKPIIPEGKKYLVVKTDTPATVIDTHRDLFLNVSFDTIQEAKEAAEKHWLRQHGIK